MKKWICDLLCDKDQEYQLPSSNSIPSLVRKYAKQFKIDPEIVAAVIKVESNGDTKASRFEEHMYRRVKKKGKDNAGFIPPDYIKSRDTEWQERGTSFGLMQCLGDLYRWHGRGEEIWIGPYLTIPENGIRLGCSYLSHLYYREKRKYGHYVKPIKLYTDALAIYNGSPEYPPKVFEVKDLGLHREFLEDS